MTLIYISPKKMYRGQKSHMKRFSLSYVIGNIQVKTRRYPYTPIRMAKLSNTDTTKCGQGCGTTGTLIHCLWGYRRVQPLWKTVCRLFTKLNIPSPYNPAIAPHGHSGPQRRPCPGIPRDGKWSGSVVCLVSSEGNRWATCLVFLLHQTHPPFHSHPHFTDAGTKARQVEYFAKATQRVQPRMMRSRTPGFSVSLLAMSGGERQSLGLS